MRQGIIRTFIFVHQLVNLFHNFINIALFQIKDPHARPRKTVNGKSNCIGNASRNHKNKDAEQNLVFVILFLQLLSTTENSTENQEDSQHISDINFTQIDFVHKLP